MAYGKYEWRMGDEFEIIIHRGDERRIAKLLRMVADILDIQSGGEFLPEIPWIPKDTFIPEIPWNRNAPKSLVKPKKK